MMNENLNQLIATNLKFEGYETESAYSGIEAIDKLWTVFTPTWWYWT